MNVDLPWMYVLEMREAKGYCLWQFARCMFSAVRVEITLLLVETAVLCLPQLRKFVERAHYGKNVTPRATNVSVEKHRSVRKKGSVFVRKWTARSRQCLSVRRAPWDAAGRASPSPAPAPALQKPSRLPGGPGRLARNPAGSWGWVKAAAYLGAGTAFPARTHVLSPSPVFSSFLNSQPFV